MRYAAIAQMGYDHSLGWINGLSSLKTGETFDATTGMSVSDHAGVGVDERTEEEY